MHYVLQNFTPLGYGVLLDKKTTFSTKIGWGWARGASTKFGTPYVYMQPLKLVTSNLVHNLVFYETSLPKKIQRLGSKLAKAWARGASEKKLRPPIYFCNRLKNWYTSGLPCQTQVLGPN